MPTRTPEDITIRVATLEGSNSSSFSAFFRVTTGIFRRWEEYADLPSKIVVSSDTIWSHGCSPHRRLAVGEVKNAGII
jgi:hypothetical protein